ncbi:hypothetical protein EC991_008958 [Linnemannia zychae]|nr:hypothetical protein EC991_008958 [Linnemannia zychae]
MDRNEASSDNNKSQTPPVNTANAASSVDSSTAHQPPTITPPPASSTTTSTAPSNTAAAAPEVAPSTTTTAAPSASGITTPFAPVAATTVPTTTMPTTPPPANVPIPTTLPATATSESSAPATAPTASTTTTSAATVPSDAPPEASTGRRNEYWCHQCQAEITPMMVPDPMCPTCYSEFVEKIESENDPRAFASSAVPAHLTEGSSREDGHQGPVNLEDLFQLFQAFYAPQRSEAQQQQQRQREQEMHRQQQQQQQQQHQQSQAHTPGQFFTTGTQYIFTSGPSGMTRTVTPLGPGGPTPAHGSQPPEAGYTLGGAPPGSTATEGEVPPGPQWHSPPSFISGLLSRLGLEIHYTTDPAAFSGGFGGPMGMGGGLLPMVGSPGDYAWGQRGLDDIITQMMELQNRQHGPVGATDEIINAIPKHTLTDEELDAKTECSVCKDEFAKEDNLLQLPCKHIFHEDCIKPWLKVSGTCPTCRFSLVGGQDGHHTGEQSPPHGGPNANTNNSSSNNHSGDNAPSGGNANASTGSGSRPGDGGFAFGFLNRPPAPSGSSLPGSFPSNNSNAAAGGGGGTGTQSGSGTQNRDNLPIEPLD